MKSLFLFAILFTGLISCGESPKHEEPKNKEKKHTKEMKKEHKKPAKEGFDYAKFGVDDTKHLPKGINVGDKAPVIEGLDINKEAFNSTEVLEDKQIVVLFYRGEWCPACNKYLSKISDSLEYIIEKDAVVLVVGPESIANAEKTVEKTDAKFNIISDTDKKIQSAFDVLFSVREDYQTKIKDKLNTDIAKNNEETEAQLPVPATYIINQKGEIAYKHFDFNYKNRASVKEILDNL